MRTNLAASCIVSVAASLALLVGAPGRAQVTSNPSLTRVRDMAYAWYDVPAGHALRIRVVPMFTTGHLSSTVECRGTAITGAYTSRTRPAPDGLVVVAGRVLARDNGRPDGGMVTLQGSSASLERAPEFRARVRSGAGIGDGDLIYSQPILIADGKVDRDLKRRERANRVALGRYRDGGSFMVMAYNTDRGGLSAVTLGQFAADVLSLAKRPVDWLINFDGGPSAFMFNAAGASISPGRGKVTSYICAEPTGGQ